MLLTGGVQQVVDRHPPQSQLEFCRLFHQTDMTEPSMHLSAPPHQLNEQVAGGLEEQALSAKKNFKTLLNARGTVIKIETIIT